METLQRIDNVKKMAMVWSNIFQFFAKYHRIKWFSLLYLNKTLNCKLLTHWS